jgi:L-asparaginase II
MTRSTVNEVSWSSPDPILVEVLRGEMVESRHCGAYAVVDAAGGVVLAQGDVEHPVYARSAIKPLQALPLVETGAAARYGLSRKEIALACASHNGTAAVVDVVEAWLNRIGLSRDDLECGADPPIDQAAAQALVRAGQSPSALHNNCSGKHAGFLTTASHCGEPTRGYIGAQHPVQRRVLATLSSMTGLDLECAPHGTDGCGIPVIGIPLKAMARAMARLADPAGLAAERAAAAGRILEAMAAEFLIVAGASRFTRDGAAQAGRRGSVLRGAAAAWPRDRAQGRRRRRPRRRCRHGGAPGQARHARSRAGGRHRGRAAAAGQERGGAHGR